MRYTEPILEDLIRKNTHYRKVHVFDTSWQYDCSAVFVDTYTTSKKKADTIAKYLQTLGYETSIIDGYEGCPTDDNHPEWLIVDAYKETGEQ